MATPRLGLVVEDKPTELSCIKILRGQIIRCSTDALMVINDFCITWDNSTESVRIAYCLFTPMDYSTCKKSRYEISTKWSGPELNEWMCGRLNRQGTQCKQCISGYGPAALSDGGLLCRLLKA